MDSRREEEGGTRGGKALMKHLKREMGQKQRGKKMLIPWYVSISNNNKEVAFN